MGVRATPIVAPGRPPRGIPRASMDPMSPPVAQTQWYLARDGQQYGPLTEAELAKVSEMGHLQPTDLLWRDGFPDWRPAMIVFPPRKAPLQPRLRPPPRAGRLRAGRAARAAAN